MKIVILGLSRTGTSALFYKLKSSLPMNTICLFEPASRPPISRLRVRLVSALTGQGDRDVLAKVLPFEPDRPVRISDFSAFDKQILIVRDPRDRLLSALLYWLYNSDFFRREDAVMSFLRLLRQKEAEPRAISVKTIFETSASLAEKPYLQAGWAESYRCAAIQQPMDFHDARPGLFVFRYEDMIEGLYGELESYMNMVLKGSTAVAQEVRRVARTRSYGTWRDWFTAEDIEHFRPTLQPYLDRYYPDAHWSLNQAPHISPEHGSRYVEMIVNERRAKVGLPGVRTL